MKHSNQDTFLFLAKTIFLVSFVSFAIFYSVSYYYNPLGTDGGWYSYPALSLSRGGDPAENMLSVEEIGNQTTDRNRGIRAVFPFSTYKSLRIIYTSYWFKIIPADIMSLKFLGLVELLLLMSIFYCLLKSNIKEKSIIYLFFSFLLLDKSIMLISSSDYRPDIAIACVSTIIFMYINKPLSFINMFIVTAMMPVAILAHITAVIPIMFLLCYHILRHVMKKEYTSGFLISSVLYFGISTITILFYDNIMSIIFPKIVSNGGSVSFVVERIGNRITQGLSFLFYKEYLRWKKYFLFSNIASLLLIITIILLYINRKYKNRLLITENDMVFLSLVLTSFSIVFVDPHLTETHVIPLIPFIVLFLAKEFELNEFKQGKLKYIISFLALGNIMITGMTSYKIYLKGNESRLNIKSVKAEINKLVTQKENGHVMVAIGPTELWPYFSIEDDIILIDSTRNTDEIKNMSKYIRKLDYIIINKEYRDYGWIDNFRQEYPGISIFKTGVIGNGENRIEVYSIKGT